MSFYASHPGRKDWRRPYPGKRGPAVDASCARRDCPMCRRANEVKTQRRIDAAEDTRNV